MQPFNPLNHPGLFGGGGGGMVVPTPSFLPQITSLSDVMDTFMQRRLALQKQALEEERLAEREAYGRRKQDLVERKQESAERFQRAKGEREDYQRAYADTEAGRAPQPIMAMDANGNPVMVQPRFRGGRKRPVAPASPPPRSFPEDMGRAEPPAPASSGVGPIPTLMGKPYMAPQIAMAATGPDVERETPTVFADEVNDGEVQALTGPGDQVTKHLPEDAFPPGVREGQRFNAADVNLRGGYGNPFAEPLPSQPLPQVRRQEIPMSMQVGGGRASVTAVPPTRVQGELYDMRQEDPFEQAGAEPPPSFGTGAPEMEAADIAPQGDEDDVWEYQMPDGRVLTINTSQIQRAKQEKSARLVAAMDKALADPQVPEYAKGIIAAQRAGIQAEIPDAMNTAVAKQVGAMELERAKQGGRMELQGARQQGAEALEQLKQDGRMALKKAGKGRGGGMFGGVKSTVEPGEVNLPIPYDKSGKHPERLLDKVNSAWREWAASEKLRDLLPGLRRVRMAKNNISVEGPNAGVVNAEAAFNYLGAVRGGVPVENETKEMLERRRTWAMKLHGFLVKAGLRQQAEEWTKGRELTREEANQMLNVMSPEEKAMLKVGIDETLAMMAGQAGRVLTSFSDQFNQYGGEGGHFLRQAAVGKVNAYLGSAELPQDFNPYNDTVIPKDASRFVKRGYQYGGAADAPTSQVAAPAQGQPKRKSIAELLMEQ